MSRFELDEDVTEVGVATEETKGTDVATIEPVGRLPAMAGLASDD